MKVIIECEDENIVAKMEDNGKKEGFDYVKLIEYLFKHDDIKLDIHDTIEDKDKIIKLFDETKNSIIDERKKWKND